MVNSCNFSAFCWLSNAGLISFPGVRPGFPPLGALRRATGNSGGEAASCPPRTAYTGRQADRKQRAQPDCDGSGVKLLPTDSVTAATRIVAVFPQSTSRPPR